MEKNILIIEDDKDIRRSKNFIGRRKVIPLKKLQMVQMD